MRGQYGKINEFKLQTAKSLAEAINYCSNRFFQRQAIHKILQYVTNEEEGATFLQIQDPLDETTNFGNQKNHSFMNESKSERDFSRQLLGQPSLAPQRSIRKMDKDLLDTEKNLNLTAGLNRSITKPGTFALKEDGMDGKILELGASESKWPAQNHYDEDKKFKLDLFSVPTKNYTSSTLRIGDIVYFKHVTEIITRKDGKPTKMVGILSGDGISSNRLECINRSIQYPKNANFSFKKCLFRVETSRKYYYQKLYKDIKRPEGAVDGAHLAEYENKLNFIKKKYNEEIEENNSEFKNVQGQPVLYGQTIHLKHLYSECYLTLQPHSLAWQYGCVQLTLEEEGSEDSNFKFMTSGNLKTKEDVVAFSDAIHFASSRGDYFMHVWNDLNIKNTPEIGLEVNGSESASNWKLLRFMDCDEYQEYEENNTFLESGDIVRIIHKKTSDTLSVPPKNLEPILSIKNIILNNEIEENYGLQRTNIPTKFIENKVPTPDVVLSAAQKYTVGDLWEIQRRNAFIGGFARWDETFRLKNVSTGLFLSQDPISERLKLTPDGMREECYFVILPKRTEDKRHRIEYGDLLRIQTFNRNYLQQPIGKDIGDLCGPKTPDTTKLLFYLEYNPLNLADTAFRLSSLFPSLLNFHCFLQNWGIHIQSGKDDVSIYDYGKALENEKELDFEAECLSESLENLEDFLKQYPELPFKIKQKLLIEQKIIEILLLIVELINTKIHGISSAITDNGEVNKPHTEEEWDILEKTPQYLARKYLDKHVRRIYKILLLSTKHSIGLANVILKNSIFLSRQLTYYRKEAGDLLKEAIKNSAQLGDADPHGEQIVKWVGLLEMIKQNDGNLPLQILYLEIISQACLDIQKRGIDRYQDQVLQEFFSPNSHFLKGLVTFAKKNSKVYVSFARESDVTKEEFIDYNDSLSPSNEINHEEFDGKIYFSLQELSVTKSPGVDQIIDYLSSVLWLFYSLCKDRNQGGINHIKGIGLQADVLMQCMLDDFTHIKLKRGFIVLYEVLFIDVEPYRTIKDCSNYCYVWEEIETKNLSEHTYLWHNSNKIEKIKDYDREKVKTINEFISEFWLHGKNIVKFSLFGVSDKFANNDTEYLEKAGLIHAMLKFTKNAVNLGFTNSALNNQILYSIINLFVAFKKAKDKEKPKERNKDSYKEEYWVSAFIKSNGLSTRSEIFDQIYLEALEIFQVIADLRLNLQILGFLKTFKISFEHGVELDKDAFNRVFSIFLQKYGLNIQIPDAQTDRSLSEQEIELLEIWKPNNEINSLFNNIIKEVSDVETQGTIQSGLIFVNLLFEVAGKNKYLEKQTRKVLKSFFDQREKLLENFKKIEIISGKREIEIFAEFDSSQNLLTQIHQLLQDDENLRQNYQIDHIEYRTRIIDITNSLNRIIHRFRQRKTDYKLTLKTQNIMRNLNIYRAVLKVFKLSYREADHKELFKSAISVLYHFCKNNPNNQDQLYTHVPELIDLIQKKLKPAKLLCQIFSNKKTTVQCHQFIDTVFEHLNDQDYNYPQTHPQYLIILRSLILDERRNAINENQRMIMSRLMKNKGFLNIIDWKVPEKQPRLNSEVREEDMAMLNYQVENLLLLGNLALDTRLGIIQAKKTLSYDQIKTILVSNATPFLQKKAFLRCLFQIYITRYEDLNKNYDKKSMIDILNSVVMPDLKIFEKYIEGVIEIPSENNEKQKKAYDLRDRVKKYRQKLSTFEGRDDKIHGGATGSTGKKLLPPINSHNDQKKILRDCSEYWEYLNSGKSWNMKQDGLLYFIIDCFYEIEQRGSEWMDENLKETLSNIRGSLNKMNEMLLKIEEEINRDESTMRLAKFTVLINECIDRLPDKKVVRLGKGLHIQSDGRTYHLMQENAKYEHDPKAVLEQKEGAEEILNDPVIIVLKKIKSFIMKRKMTLEDFMGLFRSVEDKMQVEDFRSKLKTLLGNLVRLDEIDSFIDSIQRSKKDAHEIDNKISLSKVYRKLQKSFERDRAVDFKEMMKNEELQGLMLEDLSSPDSLNISRALKKHIDFYTEFNLNNEEVNNELRDIMTALFASSKKKMTKKKMEEYKLTLTNLIRIFKKKHYGIYMLKMLKYLLKYLEKAALSSKDENNEDSDEEDEDTALQSTSKEMGEFKQIQLIFAKSDALIHCLNNIREGVPKKLVAEAVEVLNLMLKGGNRSVQTHILETLKEESLTSGFFNYIKLQFWSTLDNFRKIKGKEDTLKLEATTPAARINAQQTFISYDVLVDLRITENLIKLIQLFCENCFNEFQNFLRSQITSIKTTVVSSNLVNELANFLIDLQLIDPEIFQNTRMLPLVDASLETLIDFCMGPCQENQELLGNQRHLISFINSFVNKDINFNSSNENDLQMIDIFSTITKFLLALVNGNKNITVKEFLLNQLNIDALIRKLVVIYTTKINNRDVSIFRQDRRCPRGKDSEHSSKCAENYCVLNFLTSKDLIITETAFNIYILLTIFTDEFQDSHKLEKFRYDKLSSAEKEQLEKLEAQYKADKKHKGNLSMTQNVLLQLSSNPQQINKNQIFPAVESRTAELFKLSNGYKSVDNEESGLSPIDEPSREALISPPDTAKRLNGRESKIDFVKKLAVKIEQNPTFLDKDIEKLQEEEAYKEFFSLKERSIMYKARKFFKMFINSVEVVREDQISKNYFQVPFECDYMTENIRDHLIYKANRNSDAERLEHFFFNIPLYHSELLHRQKISRNKYFEWFVCHWKLFKDIAYISVLANNILFIVSYEVSTNAAGEESIALRGSSTEASESINLIFSIIQIALSILVVIFGIFERLPISLYKKPNQATESIKKKAVLKKTLAIEKNQASLFTIVTKFIYDKLHRAKGSGSGQPSYAKSVIRILRDKDNLYNILYLIISIIAFATTPLVYSILLLDIVKRSDDLQNIIKSITHNITQLIKAVLLGLIVMYFYAIIAFSEYRSDFEAENMNCNSLLHCWTSVVNYGIRAGGGVGEIMAAADINGPKYWSRWVFDITFFVLVIIILLNIIFGIIIDTFGDLRDTRNEELKQVEETCFICGLDKYDFDTRGNGWYEHIYKEHNIYAYLNFCIYIEKKATTECNGVEKFVKEMIMKKDIDFIPQSQALALLGKELS